MCDFCFLFSASVDGRVFIWRISEGPDEEDKPQITGKVVLAIQIVGEGKPVHPRLCWHPHKQVSVFSLCNAGAYLNLGGSLYGLGLEEVLVPDRWMCQRI